MEGVHSAERKLRQGGQVHARRVRQAPDREAGLNLEYGEVLEVTMKDLHQVLSQKQRAALLLVTVTGGSGGPDSVPSAWATFQAADFSHLRSAVAQGQ